MVDKQAESFWRTQSGESLKKFLIVTENIKNSNRDLWKSMIAVHASILGISISLMTYLKSEPNLLLTGTWVCQIFAIGFGFLIFRLDIDREFKHGLDSFEFSMDTEDISIREARGEFVGKDDEKSGLVISALMKFEQNTSGKLGTHWNDYSNKMFHKYVSHLKSSKLFTQTKLTKVNAFRNFLKLHFVHLESFFYTLTIGAFVLLLVGVLSN